MEQELNDINFDNYVVVGVSAGPDSMCLLNLLEKKTNKIIVCHINHNIREQSIIEEEYLKTYCQEHNLIFESMTIKEYKENNFENEARKIRYKYYEEILKKYNLKVPTAITILEKLKKNNINIDVENLCIDDIISKIIEKVKEWKM